MRAHIVREGSTHVEVQECRTYEGTEQFLKRHFGSWAVILYCRDYRAKLDMHYPNGIETFHVTFTD